MQLIEVVNNGKGIEWFLQFVKRKMIVAALDSANGNQCAAAEKLRVHRNTLARWTEEFGIDPKDFRRRRFHRRTQ